MLFEIFAGFAALSAASAALDAQTVGPPAPPPVLRPTKPPAADDRPRRYPLVTAASESWPQPVRLQALPSSPDWVGEDAYPPEAHRREMEGRVMFEARIGTDGVPKACRILAPSHYVELDDGTCDRAMTMRFEPARNPEGDAVEAVYRARLSWLMSDPTTFGSALLVGDLEFRGGQPTGCSLRRTGAVPREWMNFACLVLTSEAGHFLADRLSRARRATISIELLPSGAAPMVELVPEGELIARRRTEFELSGNGDLRNCRTVIDEGFAPRALDYSGACGLFLSQSWLQPGGGDMPDSGAIEIRVYFQE